ncbi:tRNA 4-thiouridine(8) synthase ThiI [Salinigranum rubrum]|uniref:Probable tRNA sulfurtransferase n=1 Tax=Salinigranum rubrum TaxID=755307 RepID=A0A2I8VJ63_9EURY|nr:THUMP domain-containing protein [Salinigranum rubrum]AUV81977.1 tRNA 4-thiouridine(8) synthase ThiI [Salinigranum rubrum]
MAHAADVVVVGYGEIGTKSSAVRRRMLDRLAENLDAVLADRGLDATVERSWARLYVDGDDPDRCARAAGEVPGAVWARPARRCEPTIGAVVEALCGLALARPPEETFAVRASVAGEDRTFSGSDVERVGGREILDRVGGRVDLDDPDRVYRAECREEAYVSAIQYDGPGGLPVGTQGTVVALVSGGIDSPVAAWHLLRRGCRVVPLYVDLGAYGGVDHRERAVETVERLRRRAPNVDGRLRIVHGGPVVERVVQEIDDTRMLSLRRAMLRMASVVAEREGAQALATGEAVGQKSSQTGPNLAVTDAAVGYPVHRPLLTRDKPDIVACARELGTFDDATLPVGCERIAPAHPETAATRAAVEAAEPDDLLDHAARVARDVVVVESAEETERVD